MSVVIVRIRLLMSVSATGVTILVVLSGICVSRGGSGMVTVAPGRV